MSVSGESLSGLLQRLDAWLRRQRRRFHEGLFPGAGPAELAALQRLIGLPLPDDLRVLLSWHNGQSGDFVGRFERDWSLMNTAAIVEAKNELDADRPSGWQTAWIPFLDNDAGDYVVLDTSRPGTPLREFLGGQNDHPITLPSLTHWMEDFVAAVERGEYHDDAERGSFLKSEA